MRTKLFLFVFLFTAILTTGFVSCGQKQDTKVFTAKVIDATMNNLMLLTEKGDTINVSTMDADPQKVPGVLLNDKVRVSCSIEKVNGNDVLKAVELTIVKPSGYHEK